MNDNGTAAARFTKASHMHSRMDYNKQRILSICRVKIKWKWDLNYTVAHQGTCASHETKIKSIQYQNLNEIIQIQNL